MCIFAAANGDVSVFRRRITGNQVKYLSSTRYCNPHCGKSEYATDEIGKADFQGKARKPAMLCV